MITRQLNDREVRMVRAGSEATETAQGFMEEARGKAGIDPASLAHRMMVSGEKLRRMGRHGGEVRVSDLAEALHVCGFRLRLVMEPLEGSEGTGCR